ncbi:hypothetical protein [Algoriphagus hitonicola]|uniref:hypothetical protein n=1 Tax=Algoriphagus hitonicola TaxID=435880 RepID=UPI00360C7180
MTKRLLPARLTATITVTSDTDDKTANADQTPALTIAEEHHGWRTYDAVGDLVEYSYLDHPTAAMWYWRNRSRVTATK